ncbi:hypothetical protein OIU74_007689 [Salix koriyanagi]|uniref:Uncharacterized protein n=1 Tax=Salix koriyanagi TaxID=2511006 RepID=A0A9Q0Z6I0_9ROSI|nr:hypothetical protein OIU74_007689 [Salix koriyanagi]
MLPRINKYCSTHFTSYIQLQNSYDYNLQTLEIDEWPQFIEMETNFCCQTIFSHE